MTIDDFNKKMKSESKKYVILDDLVLDIENYMENHPGGKFLLEHNIGRDISKFFYGGYSLDGNLVKGGAETNVHSNVARQIVETLIVARLIPKQSSQDLVPLFKASINTRVPIN